MPAPRFPVLVETTGGHKPAGFSAPMSEEPFRISMRIRERGFAPYKVRFDPDAKAWLVSIIDWKSAAAH